MQDNIASMKKQNVKWQVFRTFCRVMHYFENFMKMIDPLHIRPINTYSHTYFALSSWGFTYPLKSVYEPQFKNPCLN